MTTHLVYLLHFEEPYHHAQHYLGCTVDLTKRITRLKSHKPNVNLIKVINDAGIRWYIARLWDGDYEWETRIKNYAHLKLVCPVCVGTAAYNRFNGEKHDKKNIPIYCPLTTGEKETIMHDFKVNKIQ